MIVIVGHGPSIVGKRLGSWLDEQTVIRLKWAEIPTAEDWGSRTDYVCGSNPSFWLERGPRKLPKLDAEFWWLGEPGRYGSKDVVGRRASNKWFDYWSKYKVGGSRLVKPSTGLRAVFCAAEFLEPTEIGLIGFDNLLHPERPPSTKWFHPPGKYSYAHEHKAEHRALMDLGITITEL